VPATLVIAFGPPKPDQSPLLLALVAIAVLIVVFYALATLTTDPRVAIAGAVVLSTIGLGAGSVNALFMEGSSPRLISPPFLLRRTNGQRAR
jgi:hypothetical protein